MERIGPAWVKRYHERSLGSLGMECWVEDGSLVVEKLGIRRSASLEDESEVWKVLTNDMELNKETAEKILELVAAEPAVAGGEVF